MNMKYRKIMHIVWIILGASLLGLGFAGKIDEFWSNMGSALMLIGILQLLRTKRMTQNADYREKLEIESTDERNKFIRNKAWAWAGYLFILIVSILVIVLKLVGQDFLAIAASYSVCLMLILYWVSYYILNKKY